MTRIHQISQYEEFAVLGDDERDAFHDPCDTHHDEQAQIECKTEISRRENAKRSNC